MSMLDDLMVTVACPLCGYGMDVELLSVRLQANIFCPCCKATIQLVDDSASAHAAQREVESALASLRRSLKSLK